MQQKTDDLDCVPEMAEHTAEFVWKAVLDAVRGKVNDYVFHTWFSSLKPLKWANKALYLSVHDHFTKNWLEDHYLHLLEAAAKELQVLQPDWQLPIRFFIEIADHGGETPAVIKAIERGPESAKAHAHLNDRYTFETFVVGGSNQFAVAAAKAAAEKPGKAYNPLFVFGGVGLGKTHLMHAIGNHIGRNFPKLRIRYVPSEQFTNEVINGIRYGKMEEFHNRYRRSCDVLLIDDIQLIAGKERTQEEFFHTFNTLHSLKKQIVVSSDKLPHEIPHLEERMRTRFQWGLIADIQPPETETRIAILKKKAEEEGNELPDEVALFLADNIRSNVRELEGALIRVLAHASLTKQSISLEYARQVLREVIAHRQIQVTVEGIQKIVATYYNVKTTDLKSPRRHKIIAKPRQVAMYLCRKILQTSYPELGERFGGKDHTTILSACRKMESLFQKDASIRQEINDLTRKIED